MKFRVGQIVILLPSKRHMSAQVGATARVTGIGEYLEVEWLTNASTQSNGGYFFKDFVPVGEEQLEFSFMSDGANS